MNSSEETVLRALQEMTLFQASSLFLIENLLVFYSSILVGNFLVRRFSNRRVTPEPPSIEFREILWTVSTLLLNTAVTVAGLYLWRAGFIRFRTDWGFYAFLDIVFLFFVMDALMYCLHRVAHAFWIYPFAHKTHHGYENPRPLTLFVLNPLEALGFGSLWLLLLCIYDSSWIGMSIYLMLNVVFGALGHLGVEPFPRFWPKTPLLRFFTTSTFHAQHHGMPSFNFGFYTTIWDKFFGTLAPSYEENFGRMSRGDEGGKFG